MIGRAKYRFALLLLTATGCSAPVGSAFPPDRQKHIVPIAEYLSDPDCWGGVGVENEGVWIPVEFVVDKGPHFTTVGVASRTCELVSVVDREREAGKVPTHWPFWRHAESFKFVMPQLNDNDGLFGSGRVLGPASAPSVSYSDAAVFFDGYIMLGSPVQAEVGGPQFFNIVRVKR